MGKKNSKPKSGAGVYCRVPKMQHDLECENVCIVCGQRLSLNTITVKLYNKLNKHVCDEKITLPYCQSCKIGYANSRAINEMRNKYKQLHVETFSISRRDAETETIERLHTAIYSNPLRKHDQAIFDEKNVSRESKDTANLDLLPIDQIIYVTKNYMHVCDEHGVGAILEYDCKMVSPGRRYVPVKLYVCPKCKKLLIKESEFYMFRSRFPQYRYVHEDPNVLDSIPKLPFDTTIYVGSAENHDCIGERGEIQPYRYQLAGDNGLAINASLRYCPKCSKVYISESKYSKIKDNVNRYKFVDETEKIHEIGPKDFVTRVNVFHCTNKEHDIRDIQCLVKVVDSKGHLTEATIPAAYCAQCKKYFILEPDYQKLKDQGIIVCKIVENHYWEEEEFTDINLCHESLLHIMGYNVNSVQDISQAQRWKILEIAVDEHILSRTEICSHIDFLINRSRHLESFKFARKKWEADRIHIAEYASSSCDKIEAGTITEGTRVRHV